MKPNGTVEYNSLSWVKSQLDAVIKDAQTSLSEYIENSDDPALMQACIEGLRLVYGTLQMVEIFGAAMLAEEMENTARAILEDRVDNREEAYDVLMRALLQLPDYLEGLQAGRRDTPMSLLPLMNDMRTICKQSLLSENVLFFPDIDAVDVDEREIEAPVASFEAAVESVNATDAALRMIDDEILARAVGTQNCEIVLRLLGAGAHPDQGGIEIPLSEAVRLENPEIVDVLARRGNCTLSLVDALHAKIYVADEHCLAGSANVTSTSTGTSTGLSSETVKSSVPASSLTVTSSIMNVAVSLSVRLTVAAALVVLTVTAVLFVESSVTMTVSVPSTMLSSATL